MEKDINKIQSFEGYFRKQFHLIYTISNIIALVTSIVDIFTIKTHTVNIFYINIPLNVILITSYILYLFKKISSRTGLMILCYLVILDVFYTQIAEPDTEYLILYFLRATLFFFIITTMATLVVHKIHAFITLGLYYSLYIYKIFTTHHPFFIENISTILFSYLLLSLMLYVFSSHLRKVFGALTQKNLQIEKQNILLQETNIELERNREELSKFNQTLSDKNKKLLKREGQLKKAVSAKNKFISIIAHDLKNPSQTLKGFLEILHNKIDTAPKEKVQIYLNHAKKSSEQLNKLLHDLLDWSQSQDEDMRYEPRNINLKKLADNVIDFLKLSALNKSITIEEDIPEDLELFADYDMMFTVIRNLVTNSIKFSYENSKVFIRANKNEKGITVAVSDSGIGMEKKIIDKVFDAEMNFTSPGTNGELGTGLGLKISRELIEKHKGVFAIESVPKKGSTISFVIPQKH